MTQNLRHENDGLLQTVIESCLSPVLGPSSRNDFKRATLLALTIAAPSKQSYHFNRFRSLSQTFKALANVKPILSLARNISSLDDVFDTMSASEVLELGATRYGNTPSPFLRSRISTETSYDASIDNIIAARVLPETVEHTFSNIHAVLVTQQAKAEISYQDNKTPDNRQAMTTIDMNLAKSTLLHITEHFRGKVAESGITKNNAVSLSRITSMYPHSSTIATLFEMVDHLEDFIIDMRTEVLEGKPCPNWISTKLHERGWLLNEEQRVTSEIEGFVCKPSSEVFISTEQQPHTVQSIVEEGERDYLLIANTLPPLFKETMVGFWNLRKAGGMINSIENPVPIPTESKKYEQSYQY